MSVLSITHAMHFVSFFPSEQNILSTRIRPQLSNHPLQSSHSVLRDDYCNNFFGCSSPDKDLDTHPPHICICFLDTFPSNSCPNIVTDKKYDGLIIIILDLWES